MLLWKLIQLDESHNTNKIDMFQKAQSNGPEKQEKEGVIQNFKRTLSKKEKKEKKRREKEAQQQALDNHGPFHGDDMWVLN